MTTLKATAIYSHPEIETPHPWYPMAADLKTLRITFGKDANCNGGPCLFAGTTFDFAGAIATLGVAAPAELSKSDRYLLYLDRDGVLNVAGESSQIGEIQAHLAWYDPATDELELFDFVAHAAAYVNPSPQPMWPTDADRIAAMMHDIAMLAPTGETATLLAQNETIAKPDPRHLAGGA